MIRWGIEVVAKTATAVQISADEVIYLVSLASLWFGDQLEHSLFNANIARDSGFGNLYRPDGSISSTLHS